MARMKRSQKIVDAVRRTVRGKYYGQKLHKFERDMLAKETRAYRNHVVMGASGASRMRSQVKRLLGKKA